MKFYQLEKLDQIVEGYMQRRQNYKKPEIIVTIVNLVMTTAGGWGCDQERDTGFFEGVATVLALHQLVIIQTFILYFIRSRLTICFVHFLHNYFSQ